MSYILLPELFTFPYLLLGALVAQLVKKLPAMWDIWVLSLGWEDGDLDSIPGLGRSLGEENAYPLQCSGLESSTDCIVYGVAKSDATEQLSLHFTSLPNNDTILSPIVCYSYIAASEKHKHNLCETLEASSIKQLMEVLKSPCVTEKHKRKKTL